MNDNPYASPRSELPRNVSSELKHRLANVWVFAMVWPFVVTTIHRLTLPMAARFLTWNWFLAVNGLLVVLGYAFCIVAAVRYPASAGRRVLRGLGSIALMLACGQIARLVFNLISLA